eukprot:c45412_g1_i1.p1 GENE.c45412_g1_i1~~c45412_g1_i1.p1  ORF type:complete len:391 (+),score=66.71 c45412_g1_i1:65-1174(+)
MDASGETFEWQGRFELESGAYLVNPQVRYNTYGKLNAARDNVLFVCHALTGNSQLHSWWGEMLGPSKPFDTNKYLVVCANILGSCYGSTGPNSIDPVTNRRYGATFPVITVRDTVRLHILAVRHGIKASSVACVIGGSFGGMQALEWALIGGPKFTRSIIAIATNAAHGAWQIAISEVQRQAIYNDPKWNNGDYDPSDPPTIGLSLARQIAMITYRTHAAFERKFGRHVEAEVEEASQGESRSVLMTRPSWHASNYLSHQGQKILSRFDALTYTRLTEQMDTHDVGRNRSGITETLKKITQPRLVMGVTSDVLYPFQEQVELAKQLDCELVVVDSDDGHDAFLLAQDQVGQNIQRFLASLECKSVSHKY